MKENKQYYNKGITTIMLNYFCRKIKEKYSDSVEIENLKDYYDTMLSLKENIESFEQNFKIKVKNNRENDILKAYDSFPELTKKATILNFLENAVKNTSWHFSNKIKVENAINAIQTSRKPKQNRKLFKIVKKRFYDRKLSKEFIFINC